MGWNKDMLKARKTSPRDEWQQKRKCNQRKQLKGLIIMSEGRWQQWVYGVKGELKRQLKNEEKQQGLKTYQKGEKENKESSKMIQCFYLGKHKERVAACLITASRT